MKERLKRLRRRLQRLRLDALLISCPSNIFYVSGFSGTDSYCLLSKAGSYIITDFRYAEQAKKESPDFDIITSPRSLFIKISRLIKKEGLKKIGYESHHLTVKEAEVIDGLIGKRLHPTFQFIERYRTLKDLSEIESIKKASKIASDVLKKSIKDIKNGEREKDIAARIDFLLRKKGADAAAFPTIVASGPNASMPHAKPTSRRIKYSEPVIIDCGAKCNGYNSDLTRTHFVGKIDARFKLIYNIVKTAQSKAIDKVTPGEKVSILDRTARDYISKKGFGRYFSHATGHCIGIDVHEPPAINVKSQSTLRGGMVFSIEPAIYIPGWGGVRIEDLVLVTNKGCKVLTR